MTPLEVRERLSLIDDMRAECYREPLPADGQKERELFVDVCRWMLIDQPTWREAREVLQAVVDEIGRDVDEPFLQAVQASCLNPGVSHPEVDEQRIHIGL